MWLSATVSDSAVRAALEKMSMDLMQEATALENERTIVPEGDRSF
jgi:hypothetical protein